MRFGFLREHASVFQVFLCVSIQFNTLISAWDAIEIEFALAMIWVMLHCRSVLMDVIFC